ncbi:cell envelope integrity protein TolA [Psychrobacter sp. Marseille-P5312]|uniref:cell envelope integrity protein TolA n=1 Tax=Psychrobacter sp. Marseille-P5312 TaxID=2086574 RepID=UPI000CF724E1|nr:cell envelope integrity protein TolA [Psychrobacter sp. Marseille-P5312]
MATNSLGRLTLDLAVRLSEFTDGLTRAERETRDRTENMGKSVSKFKDQLIEDLSGTPIGGAIDSLNEQLGSISDAFGKGGIAGAAAVGAASVVASVAVMGASLVTLALQTAEADEQLVRLATRANTSTQNLQVLTAATKSYGLEMEGVGDILADAQEKLGEFSATGGGGLVDTLELMQEATNKTDAELEIFGKSLSTMDSVDAIQAVVDEMELAGATTQEVRFVTESLASGLGDIIPLWDNNGEALRNYERDLNEAGVIRTKESIEQSKILANEVEGLKINFEGVRNELVTEALPAMATLIDYFKEGTKQGGSFKDEISGVGQAINITAASVVGIAAGIGQLINAFSAVGMQMRNIGQTADNFFSADTLADKGKALFTGFFSAGALASGSMLDISSQWARDMETIDKLLDGASSKMNRINTQRPVINNSFGSVLGTSGSNVAFPYNNNGIPYRNGAVDAEIKATRALADAAKDEAKARERTAKATADASKYIQYANKGAIRNQRLNPELEQALSFLQEEGIVFKVNSGGQPGKGSGGKRVGSTAHDHGYAADGDLYKGGKKLDWNNSKDLPLLKAIVEEAAARGINGIGAGNDYMGAGRFHFGIQQNAAAWGKDGKGANAPGWLKAAHSAGMSRKYSGTFYGKALAQDAKIAEQAQREQARLAAEALRQQEEIKRAQLSIVNQYASDKEKIELDHIARVESIEEAYAEGSAERAKYLAREEERYAKEKNAAALSIMERYQGEEQRIHARHQKALKEIEAANIKDDSVRQMYVDAQNAAYQKDLDNFKFASEAKARAQDKMYQSIADSARAGGINALSTGKDSMMQRTLSDEDYQQWRLNQDYVEGFNSINNQYKSRESEINAVDERGNYALPELERFELLEIAKQEHLDKMWALEQEYALRDKTLAEQQAAQRVAIYQSLFAGMTEAAAVFFGESSRMHKLAFAAEKAYAVHKALMNVEETYSNTFNSLSAIPLFGPYIAAPGAAAAAAIQVASAASIQGMSAPSVSGIAHGGLDYVPKESTYLLDEGERVLSPKQNKDFTRFMDTAGRQGNITINNNSSAEVSARREPNGAVTIDMVDKMIEKSFRRIGRPNSLESKSIQRHTTARVKR